MQDAPHGWAQYEAITPHDTTDQEHVIEHLYVGGAGAVVAAMMDGSVVTFTGLLAGTIYPIKARRINATSTTATSLVALHRGQRTIEALGASG